MQSNVIKHTISFLFLALICIPLGEVFVPDENKIEWKYTFIWDDPISLCVYVLFALAWVLYLFRPGKYQRRILMVLTGLNALIYIPTFLIPAQDFSRSWGIPVYLILCALVLFYLFYTQNKNSRPKQSG